MMTTAELQDHPRLETPGVLCTSIKYAQMHLAELLAHVDAGGYCLIRNGRDRTAGGYWLSGQAPPWWTAMDDSEAWEAGRAEMLARRMIPARAARWSRG